LNILFIYLLKFIIDWFFIFDDSLRVLMIQCICWAVQIEMNY